MENYQNVLRNTSEHSIKKINENIVNVYLKLRIYNYLHYY